MILLHRPKNPIQLLKSQKGSLFLQMLIASSIAMIIVFGISELTVQMNKNQIQTHRKLTLMELRGEMITLLTSDAAWTNTIAHVHNSGQMDSPCLLGINGDSGAMIDCNGKYGPLSVVDGSNTLRLDSTSTSQGFTAKGASCDSFNSSQPNQQCPTRITARWVVDCTSACAVRSPPLRIEVRFENKADGAAINTNNLNFMLRR